DLPAVERAAERLGLPLVAVGVVEAVEHAHHGHLLPALCSLHAWSVSSGSARLRQSVRWQGMGEWVTHAPRSASMTSASSSTSWPVVVRTVMPQSLPSIH